MEIWDKQLLWHYSRLVRHKISAFSTSTVLQCLILHSLRVPLALFKSRWWWWGGQFPPPTKHTSSIIGLLIGTPRLQSNSRYFNKLISCLQAVVYKSQVEKWSLSPGKVIMKSRLLSASCSLLHRELLLSGKHGGRYLQRKKIKHKLRSSALGKVEDDKTQQ